jgi:hypothetical protein
MATCLLIQQFLQSDFIAKNKYRHWNILGIQLMWHFNVPQSNSGLKEDFNFKHMKIFKKTSATVLKGPQKIISVSANRHAEMQSHSQKRSTFKVTTLTTLSILPLM